MNPNTFPFVSADPPTIELNEAAANECKRLAERLTVSVPRATDAEKEQLKKLLVLIEQSFLQGWSLHAQDKIEQTNIDFQCFSLLQRWTAVTFGEQTDLQKAER